ncbi:vitamin K epoxide reductase family protein [Actinomadura rudentiformis]|uniref:Vitamin K epoxide reductase family protein n=1 Tax=Actinomadura rudentiformis TaxID=359158 RepID=A0A6H9YXQ5_9ACTN|nr:vitamin K epoxide reductase family protein [Actinomadura rudentiformis]KAB2352234.1 vitamin K epoxide reductase family protein [Actinomadura rudentiformis]
MQHSPPEAAGAQDEESVAVRESIAASCTTGHGAFGGAFPRLLPGLLAGGGAIGLLSAFVLAVEKVALLKDPGYTPSCSINPVLSCGSVMTTPQAEAFGFPNPLLGIAGFAMVTTIGVILWTDAVLPRWFWWGLQAGTTFGVLFVHWLIFQSLYRIEALCPYCMAVWAVMIPIFLYTTLHNLTDDRSRMPPRLQHAARSVAGFHGVVLTAWYLTITALILERFWSYWTALV